MTNEKAVELYKLAGFTLKKYNTPYNEDLVQELVLYALEKEPLYDERRGSWSNYIINCMYTKLLMIHRANHTIKRNKGQPDQSLDNTFCDDLPYYDVIPSDVDIAKELDKKETLAAITPLVEEPLKLHLEGFKQVQIAEKLGVSQVTVCRRIKHNIQKIKKYCKENNIEYEV